MSLSSRRDYKQQNNSSRPNRRIRSATHKQSTIINLINSINGWYKQLPKPAKVLLPIGFLILVSTLLLPHSPSSESQKFNTVTEAQGEMDSEIQTALYTPKQPPAQDQVLNQVQPYFNTRNSNTGNVNTRNINTNNGGALLSATEVPATTDSSNSSHKNINAQTTTVALSLPERSSLLSNKTLTANQPVNNQSPLTPFDPNISTVTLEIDKGDTLGELFTKNNLSYQDMLTVLENATAKNYLTSIRPKEALLVTRKLIPNDTDPESLNYTIEALTYSISLQEELKVKRQVDGSFDIQVVNTPLDTQLAHAHGTIQDSLFLAGQAAGLNDNTIMNMAGIFQWDIDFIQDIRKGDHFTVIYEQLFKNGEYVGNGAILAAEFHNNGDDFHAIRFVDSNEDSNYYAPSGKSMKKAFLRAPIAISPRVTSRFNPRRLHPVHKRVRPHRGVDYGGPLNTPILAAGDGKVIFRGRKGGYGNCVIIQHGGNITTLYAHLNKFNRKVKNGTRVKQGQTIGYLGATGTVTAKHLHYEYRLNGVHRNPRTVKLPNAKSLPKKYQAEFEEVKSNYLAQLDTIKRAYSLNAEHDTDSAASIANITVSQPSAAQ